MSLKLALSPGTFPVTFRSSHQRCFAKKETPTHVLYCKTCEIFKNVYFEEHLRTAASRVSIPVNPFHATSLFYDPLNTLENQMISDVFRGYRKKTVAWDGLTIFLALAFILLKTYNLKILRKCSKWRHEFRRPLAKWNNINTSLKTRIFRLNK